MTGVPLQGPISIPLSHWLVLGMGIHSTISSCSRSLQPSKVRLCFPTETGGPQKNPPHLRSDPETTNGAAWCSIPQTKRPWDCRFPQDFTIICGARYSKIPCPMELLEAKGDGKILGTNQAQDTVQRLTVGIIGAWDAGSDTAKWHG